MGPTPAGVMWDWEGPGLEEVASSPASNAKASAVSRAGAAPPHGYLLDGL